VDLIRPPHGVADIEACIALLDDTDVIGGYESEKNPYFNMVLAEAGRSSEVP
jgi:hypothetical protein